MTTVNVGNNSEATAITKIEIYYDDVCNSQEWIITPGVNIAEPSKEGKGDNLVTVHGDRIYFRGIYTMI